MLLWLILAYIYLCKINLSYLFLKKCIEDIFIGDKILCFLFIIFVACLVCFNSIFTTYAIFPYIRRNSASLCIIWWKIFCIKCLWFCRAIILLLRIKQLLYLGLLSLQFFHGTYHRIYLQPSWWYVYWEGCRFENSCVHVHSQYSYQCEKTYDFIFQSR